MSDVRPTDMERERAIHSLRESYAHGDLDDEQFEEKLNALFVVQSSAELRELLPAPYGTVARVLAPAIDVSSTDVDLVERQLSPGEHLEWIGKPDPKKRLAREDWTLIPRGLFVLGFAIFWTVGVAEAGGFAAVFGIPFLAVALYLVFGRFFVKSNRRSRTVYAVTSRRVLSIVRNWRGGGESVAAVYLRSIPNISTTAAANGRGSVEFGVPDPGRTRNANTGMDFFSGNRQDTGGLSFEDIEDPHGVADLVERLRDAAPAPNVVNEPAVAKHARPRDDARLPFPPPASETSSEP